MSPLLGGMMSVRIDVVLASAKSDKVDLQNVDFTIRRVLR